MSMEKYGVETRGDGDYRICPECGTRCERDSFYNVFICPFHGTEPFERMRNGKKDKEADDGGDDGDN